MKIRLGYVAMSKLLENASNSRTITIKNLEKLPNNKARLGKLISLTKENLNSLKRLLYHNIAEEIFVFRISSRLVPLSTFPLGFAWDYDDILKDEFCEIGSIIEESKIRVSMHPDHFTVLNTTDPAKLDNSIKNLEYHDRLFRAMNICPEFGKSVLHIGGMYGDKQMAIQTFIKNCKSLPQNLKERLILENDDKIFNAEDLLGICENLKLPFVLDVLHNRCNPCALSLPEIIRRASATWDATSLCPKIHFSSPKSVKTPRSHADFINFKEFLKFLYILHDIDSDFDIMLETKNKDAALFELVKNLKEAGFNFSSSTTFFTHQNPSCSEEDSLYDKDF